MIRVDTLLGFPSRVGLIGLAAAVSCGVGRVLAQSESSAPAQDGSVYISDAVTVVAAIYPAANVRLYVRRQPDGLADRLRQAGYAVDDVTRNSRVEPGYVLSLTEVKSGGGDVAVVLRVGNQTLTRAYHNGAAISPWSINAVGMREDLAARLGVPKPGRY
jgi:hypothetical protein